GGTTCSSSVCGGASNTKRCICGPTTAFPMPAIPLDAIWTSTMVGAHTQALTALRPIRPTSQSCRSARQPKPGRRSTYRRGNSVQTIGTTSERRCSEHRSTLAERPCAIDQARAVQGATDGMACPEREAAWHKGRAEGYWSSQTSSMRKLLMMLLTIIVQSFTCGCPQYAKRL